MLERASRYFICFQESCTISFEIAMVFSLFSLEILIIYIGFITKILLIKFFSILLLQLPKNKYQLNNTINCNVELNSPFLRCIYHRKKIIILYLLLFIYDNLGINMSKLFFAKVH